MPDVSRAGAAPRPTLPSVAASEGASGYRAQRSRRKGAALRLGFDPGEIAARDRRRCEVLTRLHELAGRPLACWCPVTSEWCHADTLLRLVPLHAVYERHAA